MERRTVELRVAGQRHRVVTTGTDADLRRLVGLIEERLEKLARPGRPAPPNAMFLVALELVHELEEARASADQFEARRREDLKRLLSRIDTVLGEVDGESPGVSATT